MINIKTQRASIYYKMKFWLYLILEMLRTPLNEVLCLEKPSRLYFD